MSAGEPPRGKTAAMVEDLRRMAASLPDGAPLPVTYKTLAERHGGHENTGNRAAHIAQDLGLITIHHGAGMRARHPRPLLRHGSRRLSRAQWGEGGPGIAAADAAGRETRDEVEVELGADPPPDAAEVFGPGPVTVRRRRRFLEDRPVLLSISWLPARLTAGTLIEQADSGPGGSYARLADIGQAPVRFTERVETRLATEEEAAALRLPQPSAVFEITRHAITAEGATVEVNRMILDGSIYKLGYDISA
jgi:GntR family transcriptional regulator